MMKKTYKSSLLALSVLASFTSCSESESLQQANLSKDKITFHATLDNSWKPLSPASSSRAAIAAATEKGPIVVPTPFGKPLYLHSVVQETADLQQAAAITRGAMQDGTTLDNTYYNNSFGVTAISKNNDTNTALFTNQKASKNNEDIWEIEDKTNSRWPFDALVSFHAYAPFNDATDGMWSVTTDADNVKTKIKYTAKSGETEIPSQPDIIVATNAESRSVSSDDKAVELKFSHALTAVNFAISKDLTDIFKTGATDGSKLKSIKLSGIPNEGTCELTAKAGDPQTPSQTWTFETEADGNKKTGSYTFLLEDKDIKVGESYALTSNKDKNILMMIPQNLNGTKAQLTFVLDIKGKGDQTFTFDLSNQTWLPGTSVTYKLSASAVNHLENAEVKFPDSWKDTEQVKYSYPKTDFAAGESIGLYVVNSNNDIEEANVKLTRDQDGKWIPENNNTKFLKLKNYKYFAYYPYNAAAPTVVPTKDNANEFFKDKISSLSLVADQSNEATLLAQDFQVAKGEIATDGSTLDFNMEHQVGLAVLNLTSKNVAGTRQFKNNHYMYYYETGKEKPVASDYTDIKPSAVMASDNFADANKPYGVAVNKYLQIIPFNKSMKYQANEKDGNRLTVWGKFVDWSFAPTNDNPVVAKNITVDADFDRLAHLFECTKSPQTFKAPEALTYKLQCWGAQGGSVLLNYETGKPFAGGGKGGYSYGDANLTEGKVLYVYVGGTPAPQTKMTSDCYLDGGYNGGGHAFWWLHNNINNGAGGGATHIASVEGLLSELSQKINDIYMVAGAGGGSATNGYSNGTQYGGYGGGNKGGDGTMTINNNGYRGLGGTDQEPGGSIAGALAGHPWNPGPNTPAAFGKGGYGQHQAGGAGGGAGLYGGGGATVWCSAGGGSGYVNQKLFATNAARTIAGNETFPSPSGGTETGHKGNGACEISWEYNRK